MVSYTFIVIYTLCANYPMSKYCRRLNHCTAIIITINWQQRIVRTSEFIPATFSLSLELLLLPSSLRKKRILFKDKITSSYPLRASTTFLYSLSRHYIYQTSQWENLWCLISFYITTKTQHDGKKTVHTVVSVLFEKGQFQCNNAFF